VHIICNDPIDTTNRVFAYKEWIMLNWIKFHKKTIDNNIWQRDLTAWHIFETLLLISNNGKWEGGRFQLAELSHIKPITTYKSLKRLEKAKMVTLTSNNKYTSIYICNWWKYQEKNNNTDNNKVTTKEQQSNTINKIIDNRYKDNITNKDTNNNTKILNTNKDNIITKVIVAKQPNIELNELIKFSKENNFPLQGSDKLNRNCAYNLLKKFGLDKSKKLVLGAVSCRGKQYAPSISDFMQLYRKVGDLVNYWSKQDNNKKGITL